MTHPDILTIERTGYPPGYSDLAAECILCGEYAPLDSERWCEYCRPVTCLLCVDDCPADETESGICLECVRKSAELKALGLGYLKASDKKDPRSYYIEDVSENAARWLFTKDCPFLAEQLKWVIQYMLDGIPVIYPEFFYYTRKNIDTAINDALKDFCMEDTGSFAEWLAGMVAA